MDKQNHHDDDYEFVGYISWIEECGLFFVTLAAVGSLIWLAWHTGKAFGLWS